MTAGRTGRPQARRRWRLAVMALLATAAALWSWYASAAEPPPCAVPPGTLAAALCERMRQMHEVCGTVQAGVRGHCQACLLAHQPLLCDDAEAPACHLARTAIERCVSAGPARIEARLRRSPARQVLFTTTTTVTPRGSTP